MADAPTHLPSLMIRCLVEQTGDQWQAFTLEYGLAVQAPSEEEAQHKLELMIASYLYDALVGEDKDHAAELLARRATASVYIRYYFHRLVEMFRHSDHDGAYRRPVPLAPVGCPAE